MVQMVCLSMVFGLFVACIAAWALAWVFSLIGHTVDVHMGTRGHGHHSAGVFVGGRAISARVR